MANLAASLMCCGVSKSGSPAASPMIGLPSALYLPAFAVMARVGDSLIDRTRLDKIEAGFAVDDDKMGVLKTIFYCGLNRRYFNHKWHD
jgi:hypothetical protein